jgi:aminoglycoside phosphotransferase family enzyme
MTDQATVEATPPPAPISADNVVSTQEAPPAPDSTILRTRLNALLQEPEPVSDLQKLQEQVSQFQRGQAPQAPAPKKDETMEAEMRELRDQQSELRTELQNRIDQQEMTEAGKEVSQWVTSNAEHFPLINEAGYQGVVMQKILNTKDQTGRIIDASEAGKLVEDELSALVTRCALKMGYVKRDEETAKREEAQISATTGGMNISVPPDWDNMSDDEQMNYLVRQVEG